MLFVDVADVQQCQSWGDLMLQTEMLYRVLKCCDWKLHFSALNLKGVKMIK